MAAGCSSCAWTTAGSTHDVIEVDPDGSNPRTVVRDTGFFDYRAGRAFGAAQVSPDGETVLFRSQRSGWLNFWVAPRDGSAEPRPIAASDHDQSDARWSPDGSWISYTENRDGVHSLRLVSADGSQRKALVDTEVGAALRPEWSPDGGRISYTFETPTRPAELFVIDVESGESRLLYSTVAPGSAEKLHMPREGGVSQQRRPNRPGVRAPAAGRRAGRAVPRRGVDPRWAHVAIRRPVQKTPAGALFRAAWLRRPHAQHPGKLGVRPGVRGSQQRLLGPLRPGGRACRRGLPEDAPRRGPGPDCG